LGRSHPWGTSRPLRGTLAGTTLTSLDIAMSNGTLKALAAAALIGLGARATPATAEAGRGYYHGHGGWGGGWGAGLVGFGVGAIVGSAARARRVLCGPAATRHRDAVC